MKTSAFESSASSPRLACRAVRGWIAVFGDAAAPGRSQHVAHCADCQAFFSAGDELELALRRDAAPLRDFVPAGLEQSILEAVDRSPRPRPRRIGLPLLSLAGLATAAAVAVVMLQAPEQTPSVTAPRADPRDVAAGQSFVNELPPNLLEVLRPEAEAILRQDPLQSEMDAVASNARTAVRFLAANFLPSSAQPLPPRSG